VIRSTIRAALATLLVATSAPAELLPTSEADRFRTETRAFIEDALTKLETVPGMAMAVVIGDEAILVDGFGMADVEAGLPATAETVYYIASVTKPFTALAATLLDDRGELDLDDPLADHLPGVRMDPVLVPEKVRLRDLLTHTSGIDNGPIANRLAATGDHDPATLWWLLGKSEPTEGAPLGTFRYTNVGYNILGLILDRERDRPWQDLLRDEIFAPLDMTRTTAYMSRVAEEGWPFAPPYNSVWPESERRLYLEKTDETMQSAGGLVTTAHDLARFLELQLNQGRIDRESILPSRVIARTHEPLVETDDGRPPFGQTAYGLGWSHGTWLDETVLSHAGGFAGYFARVSFMPELGIGVAVLANDGGLGSRLAEFTGAWVYEWWMDVPADERRSAAMLAGIIGQRADIQARVDAELAKRAERTWRLARPFEAYAGTYVNERWGTVHVMVEKGAPVVRMGNLHCTATPYTKDETMRIELVPGQGEVIRFESDGTAVVRLIWDEDVFLREDDPDSASAPGS